LIRINVECQRRRSSSGRRRRRRRKRKIMKWKIWRKGGGDPTNI
jgi:hypothetical protein